MKGMESQPIMMKHQKHWWYQKLKKHHDTKDRPTAIGAFFSF